MKAVWNEHIIAESDDTVTIEGNVYFPPGSIKKEYFKKTWLKSLCHWKGLASYYNLSDPKTSKTEKNAAWYYPHPTPWSKKIVGRDFKNYVAFWGNVEIKE